MDTFFHIVPDVNIHDETKYENMCVWKKSSCKNEKDKLVISSAEEWH